MFFRHTHTHTHRHTQQLFFFPSSSATLRDVQLWQQFIASFDNDYSTRVSYQNQKERLLLQPDWSYQKSCHQSIPVPLITAKYCNKLQNPCWLTIRHHLKWRKQLHFFFFFLWPSYLGPSSQVWRRFWSRKRPRRGPQSRYRGCRSGWWSNPSSCWGRSKLSSAHSRLLREKMKFVNIAKKVKKKKKICVNSVCEI